MTLLIDQHVLKRRALSEHLVPGSSDMHRELLRKTYQLRGEVFFNSNQQLDHNELDDRARHIILSDGSEVVGTYRVLSNSNKIETSEMDDLPQIGRVQRLWPFLKSKVIAYSDSEFPMASLGRIYRRPWLELSRACIAPQYRDGATIIKLWNTVARVIMRAEVESVFGLCSVPGVCPIAARSLLGQLNYEGHTHSRFLLKPRPSFRDREFEQIIPGMRSRLHTAEIPPLMRMYLKAGAKVCSEPAFDLEMNCTDFLIILDMNNVSSEFKRKFFQGDSHDASQSA